MITLDNYQGRTIAVFGLGKTGTATVKSLVAGGVAKVLAWDDNEAMRTKLDQQVQSPLLEISPPDGWDFFNISFVVLSPGIPLTHPLPHPVVTAASNAGCPCVSDLELLFNNRLDAHYIGITGTNGKSTTTSLIGHILRHVGREVQVGGNLGTPVLELKPMGGEGTYVLEVSSYQIDLLHTMHFQVGVLLNVTPDHIDRHGTFENYKATKLKLFERQSLTDAAVIAIDDPHTESIYQELVNRQIGRVVPVSATKILTQGVYVKDGILHDCMNPNAPITLDIRPIASLTGVHNWQNAAAAYAALHLHGLRHIEIRSGLETFAGLRHRLQLAATIRGVRFINDSKATNAEATANALAPYQNIYWIAGGRPKEGGIKALAPLFSHVAHAFLIGEAENDFARTLEGKVSYSRCGTLQRAVEQAADLAFREARNGAVVLLSPACASFDQWPNFEARGDAFCEIVEQMKVMG